VHEHLISPKPSTFVLERMKILKKDNKPSRRKATHPANATVSNPEPGPDTEPDPEPDLRCEFWGNLFDVYLDHPEQAFIAAQSFSILQQTLKSGPKGKAAVIESLDAAIHLLFPLSHYYPPCEELYRLGVDGKLLPQFEPEEIIVEARAAHEREAQGSK
jgi:hypothetical protein